MNRFLTQHLAALHDALRRLVAAPLNTILSLVVIGTVLVTSALYVTCMIVADVAVAWLDPRVRRSL